MSISIFDIPIPVVVIENEVEKEGYAIYVESGNPVENDNWCVLLCESGQLCHYLSGQIKKTNVGKNN